MKIGIYTPYLDTLTGGELYMLTIAEFLSDKHQVSIFWDNKNILDKAVKRFDLDLSNIKVVDNIFSSRISLVTKNIKALNYDRIIYLSDGSLPLILPRKLIVHFQFPLMPKRVSIFEKRKIFFAKKVICNSKFTKKYIDRTFNINSKVLYPPVQKIDSSEVKKENIILTVGRFQPYKEGGDFKKLGFMISAFKKFYSENRDWKMKIITSVKEKDDALFKRTIEDRTDKSIEVVKNSDFTEVIDAYKSTKIYWHAAGFGENIDENPERAEHFGISTVEAMTAGCIPIVINLGGQKEIVENGINGFLWNDEDELLNLTKKINEDSSLLKRISNQAKKTSINFSKEKFRRELEKFI